MNYPREIDVTELMATPPGRDEIGLRDDEIEHCERHDVLYHVDGRCLDCEREAEQ